MTIAVDFDGTIVDHKYPEIGKEKPFAIETLRQLSAEGHKLILWTSRDGKLLEDAVQYCLKRGVEFYAVNANKPTGSLFSDRSSTSVKVVADVYIDDKNVGGLPEWDDIYEYISGMRRKHRSRKNLFKRLFKKRRKV